MLLAEVGAVASFQAALAMTRLPPEPELLKFTKALAMFDSLVEAAERLADFMTAWTPGKSTAARMPMMAITVSSSISVKPVRLRVVVFIWWG